MFDEKKFLSVAGKCNTLVGTLHLTVSPGDISWREEPVLDQLMAAYFETIVNSLDAAI